MPADVTIASSELSESESPALSQAGRVAPHGWFAGRYQSDSDKHLWVRDIFNDTASDYDRVEAWLSLGSGKWYRRKALERARLGAGMTLADVACGTGLVSRAALTLVGPTGRVIGIDPTEQMLAHAINRLGGTANFKPVLARAESIPIDGLSVDMVSFGYALRHVEDLALAFGEFYRILKPGGKLCILEITRPSGRLGMFLLKAYMRLISGVVCRMTSLAPRTPEIWSYYWETIERCVPPEKVIAVLQAAGFSNVRHNVLLGIFSEYSATRP